MGCGTTVSSFSLPEVSSCALWYTPIMQTTADAKHHELNPQHCNPFFPLWLSQIFVIVMGNYLSSGIFGFLVGIYFLIQIVGPLWNTLRDEWF